MGARRRARTPGRSRAETPRPYTMAVSSLRGLERQRAAEERDDMFLEAHGNIARVRPRIDVERIRDAVLIEGVVQPAGIDAQAVLVADVDRDGPISLQLHNVLVDECEWRVGGPLCQNRRRLVTDRQIKIQRRILR